MHKNVIIDMVNQKWTDYKKKTNWPEKLRAALWPVEVL